MMSRFPKPRSQSANTQRPDATARTSCPEGERMNKPFHEGPPLGRWAPKRFASTPLIGSRSPRLSPDKDPCAPSGSGTRSLRRSGVAAITLPSSSTSRDSRDSSRSRCCTSRRCARSWLETRASTLRCSACCLTSAARSRSEEHTSELQSHHDLVCRLLLEKKKQTTNGVCVSLNGGHAHLVCVHTGLLL